MAGERPTCKRQVSGSNPLTGSSVVFTFRWGPCSRLGLTFLGWLACPGLDLFWVGLWLMRLAGAAGSGFGAWFA